MTCSHDIWHIHCINKFRAFISVYIIYRYLSPLFIDRSKMATETQNVKMKFVTLIIITSPQWPETRLLTLTLTWMSFLIGLIIGSIFFCDLDICICLFGVWFQYFRWYLDSIVELFYIYYSLIPQNTGMEDDIYKWETL